MYNIEQQEDLIFCIFIGFLGFLGVTYLILLMVSHSKNEEKLKELEKPPKQTVEYILRIQIESGNKIKDLEE